MAMLNNQMVMAILSIKLWGLISRYNCITDGWLRLGITLTIGHYNP